jgi:hypothetical protein
MFVALGVGLDVVLDVSEVSCCIAGGKYEGVCCIGAGINEGAFVVGINA